MYRSTLFQSRLAAAALCLCIAGGCFPIAPSQDMEDGNVGIDPGDYPQRRIRGEPNDTFAEPIAVIFNANDKGRLQGSLRPLGDVDVYAIEGLSVGDRLIVDVGTSDKKFDTTVAIFDEIGRIAFENDDRSATLQQLDPFLNVIIRRESGIYFLVIAESPLAASRRTGTYEVLITLVRGGQAPAPAAQTVVLNFAGGSIFFPPNDNITVGTFNAADISISYTGRTAQLRNLIAQRVRECYEGLALNVLVNPGNPLPTTGTYSTILFGGTSSEAFGLSQNIDSYNSDKTDESIVFTSVFRPSQFGRVLTVQELATAIGNVAAHELGHLLGLNHVADVQDLMDTTGGSLTLIVKQFFLNSPLDSTIFPIGTQDSWLLLTETLGLTTP